MGVSRVVPRSRSHGLVTNGPPPRAFVPRSSRKAWFVVAAIALAAGLIIPAAAKAQLADDNAATPHNARGCDLGHRYPDPANPADPPLPDRHFDIFWNTAADTDPAVRQYPRRAMEAIFPVA